MIGDKANEALEQVDVESVLDDEGLDYKMTWGRSGKQINVRCCPFCGNNKWKVYINADSGLGNCFAGSCSQGTFNKWQLLQAVYDLSGRDLHQKINYLAIAGGWRPRCASTRFEPGPLDLPTNYKVADLYAMPKYLLDRGLDNNTAAYFDLRWCDNGKFTVTAPDGKTITQDYSNRILIPIYDLSGTLVSFQGRDTTDKSDKRYLFPPMYASTGSHLYNLHNWVQGMDTVVIGEGPFDVIGLKRGLDHAGLNNMLPVGSFGMTFSTNPDANDQLNKLLLLKERGLKRVVFMWDNEPEAIRRAISAALVVMRYGFEVSVAVLKDHKDPGDATPQAIQDALEGAHPIRNALAAMLLSKKLAP